MGKEADIISRALANDVGVYGISPYYLRPASYPSVGQNRPATRVCQINEDDIREGVRRLAIVTK